MMVDIGLLKFLVDKYEQVLYDEKMGMLKITVDKSNAYGDLDDIMNGLFKETGYHLSSFKSDTETYTFTYDLMME